MSEARRVAVLGAGPAGLSAAAALRGRGHEVLVLEKEPVVGGKCHTLTHRGVDYDLGANLTTARYTRVRALGEELGLTLSRMPPRRIINLSAEDFPRAEGLWDRLRLRGGQSLYDLARAFTGVDQLGYAGLRAGVERPFGEWLRAHGLGAFEAVFANLFIAYGYGVMCDLPAAYALKFFDPVHMNTAVDVVLGEEVSDTRTFAEGFQALWVRLVQARGLEVRTEVELQSVVRSPQGVALRWLEASGQQQERFDDLVLAMPLDATLDFLDASPEERRLLSQIRTNDYFVTAAVVRDAVEVSTFVHPYATEFTPGQPTLFYSPRPELEDDLFFFYAYGDGQTTVEEVQDNIRRLLERPEVDGRLEEVITTRHWRYFPHVRSEQMRAGFYDDLEALQGRWRTWYVGEIMAFSLIELIVEYSEALVARHFDTVA